LSNLTKRNRNHRTHANLQDVFARSKRVESGCIEWQLTKSNGYGQLYINRKMTSMHRWVATLVYGAPKANQFALHSCDNPSCVNPDHLRWGTAAENSREAVDRDLYLRGQENPFAKLTNLQIPQILEAIAAGESMTAVARKLGVSRTCISDVARGRTWQTEVAIYKKGLTNV